MQDLHPERFADFDAGAFAPGRKDLRRRASSRKVETGG